MNFVSQQVYKVCSVNLVYLLSNSLQMANIKVYITDFKLAMQARIIKVDRLVKCDQLYCVNKNEVSHLYMVKLLSFCFSPKWHILNCMQLNLSATIKNSIFEVRTLFKYDQLYCVKNELSRYIRSSFS